MYICICKQITDKQIREAIDDGADFGELQKIFGLALTCGTCLDCVHEIIAEHRISTDQIKIINSTLPLPDQPQNSASR